MNYSTLLTKMMRSAPQIVDSESAHNFIEQLIAHQAKVVFNQKTSA